MDPILSNNHVVGKFRVDPASIKDKKKKTKGSRMLNWFKRNQKSWQEGGKDVNGNGNNKQEKKLFDLRGVRGSSQENGDANLSLDPDQADGNSSDGGSSLCSLDSVSSFSFIQPPRSQKCVTNYIVSNNNNNNNSKVSFVSSSSNGHPHPSTNNAAICKPILKGGNNPFLVPDETISIIPNGSVTTTEQQVQDLCTKYRLLPSDSPPMLRKKDGDNYSAISGPLLPSAPILPEKQRNSGPGPTSPGDTLHQVKVVPAANIVPKERLGQLFQPCPLNGLNALETIGGEKEDSLQRKRLEEKMRENSLKRRAKEEAELEAKRKEDSDKRRRKAEEQLKKSVPASPALSFRDEKAEEDSSSLFSPQAHKRSKKVHREGKGPAPQPPLRTHKLNAAVPVVPMPSAPPPPASRLSGISVFDQQAMEIVEEKRRRRREEREEAVMQRLLSPTPTNQLPEQPLSELTLEQIDNDHEQAEREIDLIMQNMERKMDAIKAAAKHNDSAFQKQKLEQSQDEVDDDKIYDDLFHLSGTLPMGPAGKHKGGSTTLKQDSGVARETLLQSQVELLDNLRRRVDRVDRRPRTKEEDKHRHSFIEMKGPVPNFVEDKNNDEEVYEEVRVRNQKESPAPSGYEEVVVQKEAPMPPPRDPDVSRQLSFSVQKSAEARDRFLAEVEKASAKTRATPPAVRQAKRRSRHFEDEAEEEEPHYKVPISPPRPVTPLLPVQPPSVRFVAPPVQKEESKMEEPIQPRLAQKVESSQVTKVQAVKPLNYENLEPHPPVKAVERVQVQPVKVSLPSVPMVDAAPEVIKPVQSVQPLRPIQPVQPLNKPAPAEKVPEAKPLTVTAAPARLATKPVPETQVIQPVIIQKVEMSENMNKVMKYLVENKSPVPFYGAKKKAAAPGIPELAEISKGGAIPKKDTVKKSASVLSKEKSSEIIDLREPLPAKFMPLGEVKSAQIVLIPVPRKQGRDTLPKSKRKSQTSEEAEEKADDFVSKLADFSSSSHNSPQAVNNSSSGKIGSAGGESSSSPGRKVSDPGMSKMKSSSSDANLLGLKGNILYTEEIEVYMYVEDKTSHHGPIPLKIPLNINLGELKTIVECRFDVPRNVQRWIIGKNLVGDDKVLLQKAGIIKNGGHIFLYITSQDEFGDKEGGDTKKKTVATKDTKEPAAAAAAKEDKEPAKVVPKNRYWNFEKNRWSICELSDEEEEEVKKGAKVKNAVIDAAPPPAMVAATVAAADGAAGGAAAAAAVPKNKEVKEMKEDAKAKEKTIPKESTFLQLEKLDNMNLIPNLEDFECKICFCDYAPGDGIVLRECLHIFCRDCLKGTIEFSDSPTVKCPYKDDEYSCDMTLLDREVKALVSVEVYEKLEKKSLQEAQAKAAKNAFNCKTPDCKGWCFINDEINSYNCPLCKRMNCITCQAIHEGMDCRQYQQYSLKESSDENSKKTQEWIDGLLKTNEALNCPSCQVLLLKKWGCDWVRCSYCRTEICWVTKQLRWGPNGRGDTSGGCKCMADGRTKCHPMCNYCH